MGTARKEGLVEVEPPPRYRPRGGFTLGQLVAIARQLRRGVWVSDKRSYESRSAANYRAEALITRLDERGLRCTRRTWQGEDGKWQWAIRARE